MLGDSKRFQRVADCLSQEGELRKASKLGEAAKVKELIGEGVNVDGPDAEVNR